MTFSSNNSQHSLSFLSLWKEEKGHHCVLLPNIYGINGCSILLEYLAHSRGSSVESILSSPDFLFHTTFAESSLPLTVDHVRKLTAYAQNTAIGEEKVIIIQDIETASNSALNALLKIIEEPPKHTMFYMVYSNINSIMPTVRSRSLIIRENIVDIKQFNVVASFLKLSTDFQVFAKCGYNLLVYKSIINIKDFTFADILTKIQSRGGIDEEVFAFLEYQMQNIDIQKCIHLYKIYKDIFRMRKQIRVLKTNEQNALVQLIESVHALARG